MKGFFKWFKNNVRIKRWIFLILIGIVLACAGISKLFVAKTISFIGIAKVIGLFVVGFTFVVVGIIFIQKRVLEILVESTDNRMQKNKKGININELIFNKKIYDEGPNIVVIGGGAGLDTVLRGLKKYTNNLTAIVTVSSYGQPAKASRKKLELFAIDDIKESIIALANDENATRELLDLELKNKVLKGFRFTDIFFTAMNETSKNIAEAVEKTKNVLNIVGRVLPVTLDEIKICAELNNGEIIEDREKISKVVNDRITKIDRVFINPTNCMPAPGVLEAIKNADAIIIGPGSLYTNVIPNLLVNNVSRAIKESKALKIYISNIMTEPGQTDNYSLSDHVNAIMEHAGKGIIDYCIYDSGDIIPEYVKRYNMNGSDVVECDIAKTKELGIKLLEREFSYIDNDNIRHNPDLVAQAIIELVCDDLKFKSNGVDPKQVMLNAKLKEEKRIQRRNKVNKQKIRKDKVNKSKNKSMSKFNEKYRDRILSIQNSDFQREQNLRLAEEIKNKNQKTKKRGRKKKTNEM